MEFDGLSKLVEDLPPLFCSTLREQPSDFSDLVHSRRGRPPALGLYASTSERLRKTRPEMTKVENFPLRISFAIACRLTWRALAAAA